MARTTQEDLQKKVDNALKQVAVGAQYTHFKDPTKLYVVESIGLLENTEEVCVSYRALYGKGILWIRTLEDFFAKKEVGGKKTTRFNRVE